MTARERLADDLERALRMIQGQALQVTPSCLILRDAESEIQQIKRDVDNVLAKQPDAKMRECLTDIYETLEGYIDGAPDAGKLSNLANGICRDIKEALQ